MQGKLYSIAVNIKIRILSELEDSPVYKAYGKRVGSELEAFLRGEREGRAPLI